MKICWRNIKVVLFRFQGYAKRLEKQTISYVTVWKLRH